MSRMVKKKQINIIGIIPARMASTRFPGKPLAKICGIPMIEHVYLRSKMARVLNEVYIATCDKEIKEYCMKANINAVMTRDTHTRASDRAAEAMLKIEQAKEGKVDIVAMVQGDEPMVFPEMIDLAVEPLLKDKNILVTNLMARLKTKEEQDDPNVVKVVVDKDNFALYFSRESIPSAKKIDKEFPRYKQVPIIPFRRDFLITFNNLLPTSLEIIESVDMLRALEHGFKVKMVPMQFETYGVDTLEDLKRVDSLMKSDRLFLNYRLKEVRDE